jgi:hypothetical protein
MKNSRRLIVSIASLDRDDGPSRFEFALVVIGLFVRNVTAGQGAKNASDRRAASRIGQDGREGAASDHRTKDRDDARDDAKPDEPADARPGNHPRDGARSYAAALVISTCRFREIIVGPTPGNADLLLVETSLIKVFHGCGCVSPVFEHTDDSRAAIGCRGACHDPTPGSLNDQTRADLVDTGQSLPNLWCAKGMPPVRPGSYQPAGHPLFRARAEVLRMNSNFFRFHANL